MHDDSQHDNVTDFWVLPILFCNGLNRFLDRLRCRSCGTELDRNIYKAEFILEAHNLDQTWRK